MVSRLLQRGCWQIRHWKHWIFHLTWCRAKPQKVYWRRSDPILPSHRSFLRKTWNLYKSNANSLIIISFSLSFRKFKAESAGVLADSLEAIFRLAPVQEQLTHVLEQNIRFYEVIIQISRFYQWIRLLFTFDEIRSHWQHFAFFFSYASGIFSFSWTKRLRFGWRDVRW